ncbi:MAG: hypothetical protein HY934_05305 [Candidatus Firestonebacteria bacterium]|nr:hypothetical protein [Candidatus Firestonebacteria bacterium]
MEKMKFIKISFIVCILLLCIIFIQTKLNAVEINQLIDIPTAAVVRKGNYQIDTRLFTNGGVLLRGEIGLAERFNLGISYGGVKIISEENPEWNPNVAIDAKYRLSDGGVGYPAIGVGYDGQGYGLYNKKDERYRNKSKGLYMVLSHEYKPVGEMHVGTNYSFEDKDDKSGNVFLGINRWIGPEIMAMADYDLGLNDDDKQGKTKNNYTYKTYGSGKGYLNAGIRWYFAPELVLEFNVLNITRNGKKELDDDKVSRIIKISYTNYFDFSGGSHGK